jgi:plasmid stabilization system protein ParE
MPHLEWSGSALVDVNRLAGFLRPKNPDAAKRAVLAIQEGARLLENFPNAGRPLENMDGQFRELSVGFGASGYFIYYSVSENAVTILAVRHAREAGY